MSVAKVVEILASSPDGFDAAVRTGIERAATTLDGIKGAWVKDQQVVVVDGKVTEFRVALKITFVLHD
ncbi:hypothetical protein D3C83_165510 [compost metagenome]